MIEGVFVEGLIYGIMALGVFITFRVLNFPDLSVDGTFPLGAAVMASSLTAGLPLPLCFLLSVLATGAAGAFTGIIHTKLRIPHLLSGILTMTMLWSVNIRVLGGRANLSLLRVDHFFSLIQEKLSFLSLSMSFLLVCSILAVVVIVLLSFFFRTDLGLTLGALGGNEQMVISQGSNPASLKIIGVGVSNAIVGFAGALATQYQGFADVSLGQGIIISGLASVMIGEFILRSSRISIQLLRVVLGSILFRGIMYAGRYYGYYIFLRPNDLRLLAGVLIISLLLISSVRSRAREKKKGIKSIR